MKSLIPIIIIVICLCSCSSENESSILNQAPLNFTEVMTFEVDTLDLDMTSVISENSIYITSSNVDVYPEMVERVLKYNLSTSTQTDLIHFDDTESRQIEVHNDVIYSFSYAQITKYDLNISNSIELNHSSWLSYSKATKYNNDILLVSGKSANTAAYITNMPIKYFNTTTENFSDLTLFPNGYRIHADGEVYADKLYLFGGIDNTVIYDDINIYDIINDIWTQENLPYQAFESFTSLYNDSIIVVGNKNADNSRAFVGIYDIPTNTYSELDTSLNLNNITIRGITILNNEVFIAYADIVSPMPNIITIKVVKALLN